MLTVADLLMNEFAGPDRWWVLPEIRKSSIFTAFDSQLLGYMFNWALYGALCIQICE